MHTQELLLAVALVALASVIIMYASDSFETAASFLGRHMAPGIKGATINAVGSSMPELLTTAVFLFLYQDLDGFSAGVATAAGSAVFNGLIIPALCIFVVVFSGVKIDGKHSRMHFIEIDRKTIIRDGFWLVLGELTLIYFLGSATLTWFAGAALLLCYVGYFVHLMYHNKKHGLASVEDEDDPSEDETKQRRTTWGSLLRLDFHTLIFAGRKLTDGRAWVILAASVAVLGAACTLLAEAVIRAAEALEVPTYFTAVVLAAAATSVPDTVLSVKDARNGLYDDAVSNALGSNIFDIAVSLGLPLFVYSLVFGDVALTTATGTSAAEVQLLRIVLLVVTVAIILLFLAGKRAGLGKAVILLAIYAGWMAWIADSAFDFGLF